MIGRNEPCWCGSRKKYKKCHWPHPACLENSDSNRSERDQIFLKTEEQIAQIRQACHVASTILGELMAMTRAGLTTKQLDDKASQLHQKMGATPAALHYGAPPFPASICTSINEVICHGIPSQRILKEGDIVNIDVASSFNGYYGDCSAMVCIGEVEEVKKKVVQAAYEAVFQAIQVCKPRGMIFEIGDVIESVAQKYGCSVVEQFIGHGVGLHFHEGPEVPCHYNSNRLKLIPGMTFTIEPMINGGSRQAVIDESNQWEARTADAMPSAQFEHTILITEKGCEVLTHWDVAPSLF